jgi:Protein of unknown function (DUF2795)
MSTTTLWTFRDETLAAIDLQGFRVRARDGEIGTVVHSTGGDAGGYLIIDPGVAMPLGRQLLVPAGLVEAIDVDNEQVSVRADREQIRNAPEYDPTRQLDRPIRSAFGSYYDALTRDQPGRRARPRAAAGSRLEGSRESAPRRAVGSSAPSARRAGKTKEPTKDDLYAQAKKLGIEGRSKMTKAQLGRAVERHAEQPREGARGKANPVEVQAFLEGVGYPTGKRELVREAESQGASRNVRATLRRLPEQQFESPTEVSEAIGELD